MTEKMGVYLLGDTAETQYPCGFPEGLGAVVGQEVEHRPEEASQSYNNLRNVEVIDALMGSGKTHAAIKYVEAQALSCKTQRWIYCTESLDEIGARTQSEDAAHLWRTPKDSGGSKTDQLVELLASREVQLVAISHKLFIDTANHPLIRRLVSERGYQLLLDETLPSIIEPWKGMKPNDICWHFEEGRLRVDPKRENKLRWVDDSARKYGTDISIGPLLKVIGRLHAHVNGRQVSLVHMPDASLFTSFHRVLITTYQFDKTEMDAYFRIKGIPWVRCTDVRPRGEMTKARIRGLIVPVDKHDSTFAEHSLTATWYADKQNAATLTAISNAIRNVGDWHCDGDPSALGWTVFVPAVARSSRSPGVYPKGYAPHKYKPKEKPQALDWAAQDEDPDELESEQAEPKKPQTRNARPKKKRPHDKRRSCLVPCTARASNDYDNKAVMVYAVNRSAPGVVVRFLRGVGIDYCPDRLALNSMLQWIWRSRIRKGEPIHLAIFSSRMRALFCDWLEASDGNVIPMPAGNSPSAAASANDQTMDKWIALYG